jgi:hypothetical protein
MFRAVQLAVLQCARRSDALTADLDQDQDEDVDVDVTSRDVMDANDGAVPALEEESPACKALAHVLEKLAHTNRTLRQVRRAKTLVEQVYRGNDAYDALKRVKETLECLGLDVYNRAPAEEPNAELWQYRANRVREALDALHTLSSPYSGAFLL